MKNPIVAGLLSLVVPGVGQIYNGKVLRGVLWFLFAVAVWPFTFFLLGFVPHLAAGWCAYSYAKDHPVG